MPQSTLYLRGRGLFGGSDSVSKLINTERAAFNQVDDDSKVPVLGIEHSVSEISQPSQVSDPETTAEMLKRLRSAHGGVLDASKLSDQEKVAIDRESSLLTKQEKRNF